MRKRERVHASIEKFVRYWKRLGALGGNPTDLVNAANSQQQAQTLLDGRGLR